MQRIFDVNRAARSVQPCREQIRSKGAASVASVAPGARGLRAWYADVSCWIGRCAVRSHFRFIDYCPLLAGPSGQCGIDLGNDGVHPNRSGYRLMCSLVEKEVLRPDR
jgi:lysophospholipase L1-like esterase